MGTRICSRGDSAYHVELLGPCRQKLAIETHAQLSPAESCAAEALMPVAKASQPLFSKDTVYHAGICSFAVSTRDASNYQSFFKKKDLVPGHSFHAVSISRSKQDRYLIKAG